jgi:hypothetical protein
LLRSHSSLSFLPESRYATSNKCTSQPNVLYVWCCGWGQKRRRLRELQGAGAS